MKRYVYVNPTGYPIEQLPKEWHGISPFPYTKTSSVTTVYGKERFIEEWSPSLLAIL